MAPTPPLASWTQRMFVTVLGLMLLVPLLAAQPPEQDKAEQTKSAVTKKVRGRLPAYFARVVTQQQREDIYEIQARYNVQIEDLQKQIDELIQKRDKEVEAVLSAEQLAEVKKMRDDAKKKRTARRQSSTTKKN